MFIFFCTYRYIKDKILYRNGEKKHGMQRRSIIERNLFQATLTHFFINHKLKCIKFCAETTEFVFLEFGMGIWMRLFLYRKSLWNRNFNFDLMGEIDIKSHTNINI